jgi:hypothetical protein
MLGNNRAEKKKTKAQSTIQEYNVKTPKTE